MSLKYKLIFLLLFFYYFLFSQSNDYLEKFEFLPLLKNINKFYTFSDDKKIFITYLDKENRLKISSFEYNKNNFILINTIKIYDYQKEDNIVYLKGFYNNGNFYICHMEKFSQKLILTYFDKKLKPKSITLIYNINMPEAFISNNNLILFYLTNNRINCKIIELNKFKQKTIQGENNILSFKIVKNKTLYGILWKFLNKKEYLYFSIMDEKLTGFSKIYKINYKKENLPFLVYKQKMNFVFNYNNIPYFFTLNKDKKENEYVKSGEISNIFSDYEIINFNSYNNINIIVFRNRIEITKKEYQDFLEIAKFDEKFNLTFSFIPQKIKGCVIENQFLESENNLFLFIIDSYDNSLKYSQIN